MKALVAVLILLATPGYAECRLALALGLDVSGSVDDREYRLQMDGLAAALQSPEVQAQVLALPAAPIWLAIYEWSGSGYQRLVVDWTPLRRESDITTIAATLRTRPRPSSAGATAIGQAMYFADYLFRQRPGCQAYTLDLAGDGESNDGQFPQVVRREDRFEGVTINGLVIASGDTMGHGERQMEMMALSAYFRTRVIWGPGAFIEIARGFEDFERAMTRKLLRETKGILIGRN